MEFIKIDEIEFQKFTVKHPDTSFFQTVDWAKLKNLSGWDYNFLAVKEKKSIIAASLVLSKKLIGNKKIFYAPRGILIDYTDKELLKFFTNNIVKYAKKNGGVLFKMDPYLEYKERDMNGDIVLGGTDNSVMVDNLKSLGYKHSGFTIQQSATLQMRWMYTLNVKDKTIDDLMKDMEPKTRQIIRKNEKSSIYVREVKRDELDTFKDIMQHTGDRRGFTDRPLSYLQDMWDSLYSDGMLKVLIAEINFKEYYENTVEELDTIRSNMESRKYKKENNILNMNENKYKQSQEKDEQDIKRLTKQLGTIKDFQVQYGDKTTLGGIMFLTYGNEVLSLYGGSYKDLMQFQSAYNLHWEMIKYACLNGYNRYNFYGISGDFSPNSELYGLYVFKKSFGGQVVELIGEFDLPVNAFWYRLYKIAMFGRKILHHQPHIFHKGGEK